MTTALGAAAPEPVPAIGVQIEEPAIQSFDDAFSSALKEEEPAAGAPAPAVTAVDPPAPETGIELPDPAAPPAPVAPVDDGTLTNTRTATDEALTRLADMMSQRPAAAAPTTSAAPAAPQDPFSATDRAALDQFYTDYPDIARAAQIERKAEYAALTQHIFTQVGAYFAPRLALLEQLADRTVYGDLTTRVPDYDAVRDKLIEWVGTQPSYLQAAYNNVIQAGTVDEITDLFDRYRQETGAASPQPNAGIAPQPQAGRQSPPSPAGAPELSPAAKQAAARLAPVTSKRSAPTNNLPVDFDAAFAEFAKTA